MALFDSTCARRSGPGPIARAILTTAIATTAASSAAAQLVATSPDISLEIGFGATYVEDHDVVIDTQTGIIVTESLGPIPVNAEITGYMANASGARYFALDTTVQLGGVVARPGDVVRYDGSSYAIAFDASAEGVPAGVTTDAISHAAAGGLVLSFDTDVDLGGLYAADEDLVTWTGSGFEMAFDGSAAGIPRALDVDAAQDLGAGVFLVSLDSTADLGGVVVRDEDVARYSGSSWSLEYDASAVDADWERADLQAIMVPEPATAPALAIGALGLTGLARARRGRGRVDP